MEHYSVREVLEQAIQTEKLGREFYTNMSLKFESDEKIKELFDSLALKELEHEQKFADLRDKIDEEMLENWEEASQYLRAIVESEFFLGKNKSLPSMDHFDSPQDVVRYAIGFEKETLLYYLGLRDSVNDEAILDEIIEEEKRHIRVLSELKKKIQ